MIHALLLDDEENIRKGIASILKNSDLDMGNIHECESADEALLVLRNQEIDVIIADIQMPGITGLQFVKEANAQKKKMPPVIFLSGYAEFEYAAEAVRLQAFAYLLKPVDIQELIETVQQAVSQETVMEDSLLHEILSAKVQSVWLNNMTEQYHFSRHSIFQKEFVLQLICCEFVEKENDFLEQNRQQFSYDSKWFAMRFQSRLLVISHPKNQEEIINRIEEKNIMTISQSSVCTGVHCLKSALREVWETEKYHRVQDKKYIGFSDIQNRVEGKISAEDFEVLENFRNQDEQTLLKSIKNLFSKTAEESYLFSYYEEIEQQISEKIIRQYKFICQENSLLENGFILANGVKCYQEKLLAFFREVKEALSPCQNGKNDYENKLKTLEKAVIYINQNFEKNINMASVSNYVGLNYYYFSNMFKKMTGQSFVDYLKTVRTNHAKRLLADSDLKIADISKKCGYDDAKQFSKIFKKLTGMSPKEYQRFNSNSFLNEP